MPIYEYACRKCGKTAEYMQRMSDPPKRKCEHCGGQSLERVISQTSFQLKGSGWYKDLYSSPKPGGEAKSDSGSSGGESSEGATKSDASSGTTSDAAATKSDAPSKPASKPDAPKASSKGTTRVSATGRGSKASGSKAGGGKAKKGSR